MPSALLLGTRDFYARFLGGVLGDALPLHRLRPRRRHVPPAGPDDHTPIEPVDPDGDIEDPIGQGQDAYDRVAARLDRVLPERLEHLLGTADA